MKIMQVYDPPMCCATGVCGTSIDPDVVNLLSMLSQLVQHGIVVQRFNLGQQPQAFSDNPLVKNELKNKGTAALPLLIVDGKVQIQGHYPTATERSDILRAALGYAAETIA